MNQTTLTQRWLSQVAKTMTPRNCTHGEATCLTAKAYPNFYTLVQAAGRTRQTVVFLNSKLAHGTPLKTAEDRKRFNQFVNEALGAGLPYDLAHSRATRQAGPMTGLKHVKITMPGQLGRRDTTRPQFSNADSTNNPPIGNEQMMGLFFLPKGTSVAEFLAAWEANGGKATPIDYAKIFDGLVQLDKSPAGGAYQDSLDRCKDKYPDLWSAVDALSKMPV